MQSVYDPSGTGAYPQVAGSYPVRVDFPRQETYNRFWAIPIIGYVVKLIILIPHLIVLAVLGIVVSILQFVTWIPVLFNGRYPEWGYTLVAGYFRWHLRVQAFLFGLSDTYPSFTLQDPSFDTQTVIPAPITSKRFWAIPIVGRLVKNLMLIPHIIVLYVLLIIIEVMLLVTWIPVLFGGRYPDWGYNMVGGYLRWATRVAAFSAGLTDIYPPFQLAD